MSNRDRQLARYGDGAKARELQPFVALLGSETNGQFSATVNGRSIPRVNVSTNEFAFGHQGAGEGDEVVMIASDSTDLPTIIGLSNWMVNQ